MRDFIKDNIILTIALILGIIMLLGGIYLQVQNTSFYNTALKTKATILDVERKDSSTYDNEYIDYYCDIEYSIEGNNYKSIVNVIDMSYDEYLQIKDGRRYTINIYYNPDNPEECKYQNEQHNGYMLIGFAILWISVILIAIISEYKKLHL